MDKPKSVDPSFFVYFTRLHKHSEWMISDMNTKKGQLHGPWARYHNILNTRE